MGIFLRRSLKMLEKLVFHAPTAVPSRLHYGKDFDGFEAGGELAESS